MADTIRTRPESIMSTTTMVLPLEVPNSPNWYISSKVPKNIVARPTLGLAAAIIAPNSRISIGQYFAIMISAVEPLLSTFTNSVSPTTMMISPMMIADDLLLASWFTGHFLLRLNYTTELYHRADNSPAQLTYKASAIFLIRQSWANHW